MIAATGGEPRRLTYHPGGDVAVAWAPDGKSIVFASNRTTERDLPQLWTVPVTGGPAERVALPSGNAASYSADGKRVAYQPFPQWQPAWKHYRGGQASQIKNTVLWLVDVEHPTPVEIDQSRLEEPLSEGNEPAWSPDSQWITYAKPMPNLMHAVFVYSLADKSTHQLTDPRSDARAPRFDRSGKYLWFVASTNLGPATGASDMSALGRATTGSIYGIVLRKDLPSPFASESDEEAAGSGSAAATKTEPKSTRIDLDNIDQRIIAAPIPRANYLGLEVGDNSLFVLSTVVAQSDEELNEVGIHAPAQVQKFDLKTRKLRRARETPVRAPEAAGVPRLRAAPAEAMTAHIL
ncbi:MAG: hypothetical protein ABJE66_06555 [Deltaproteobacteria bacterium]